MAQSIPATEHSVMTAWPSEQAAIENMIDNFGTGIFACVMDSYDYARVSARSLVCSLMCVVHLYDYAGVGVGVGVLAKPLHDEAL